MRALKTVIFLFISNTFMTFAWYGHLKFKDFSWGKNLGLFTIILISWGLAFFEYLFQVPANRAGFEETGGPFNLTVFMIFTTVFFKTEKLAWNYFVGFGLIVLAVFVIFKKW
jgi:uncharacterized protein (DUF486 family)